MIRDLESLLLHVLDDGSREYMGEAIRCYNASAYRAAVVMSVAAGMDDLWRKLDELSRSGGASQTLKDAQKDILQKRQAGDTFEAQLIDKCEHAAGLLTQSEASKLRLVLKTRHLCAHPSGHVSTAEEGRDAITSIVDLVLSRPAVMGMAGVSALLTRVQDANFFPSLKDEAKARQAVAAELAILASALRPALVSHVVSRLIEIAGELAGGKPDPAKQRARQGLTLFMICVAKGSDNDQKTVWKYAARLLDSSTTNEDLLRLLARDPKGLTHFDGLSRDRALALLRRHLDVKAARLAASALRHDGVLTTDEVDEIVDSAKRALIVNAPTPEESLGQLTDIGWPELDGAHFEHIIDAVAGNQWDVANPAIRYMQALNSVDAQRVTGELRVKYLLHLGRNAAQDSYAANAVKTILANGLDDRASFLDDLAVAVATTPAALLNTPTRWDKVARIALASARDDVADRLIDLFPATEETSVQGLPMLDYLAKSGRAPRAAQVASDYRATFPDAEWALF